MGVSYFNCVNCNEIDGDAGYHGECEEGHQICNSCNKEFKHDENGWIIDCSACEEEKNPPEPTYTESEIREALNYYEDFNLVGNLIDNIIDRLHKKGDK